MYASELVTRRATAVVESIADPQLRERVARALVVCDDALEAVDCLDLSPHEMAELDTPDLATWNALAPDVRNLLVAVRQAAEQLSALFPAHPPESDSIDLDGAFDQLESGLPPPIRDRRDQDIDAIVSGATSTAREDVGQSIAALAAMLQRDFVSFGQRLRNPRVVADRWFLLGELQELRSKCAQCLEAVVASLLGAFTHERLEAVLPRYASATARAVKLRAAIVDLAHDVAQLNDALASGAPEQAGAIRHALILRLNVFAEHPACVHLRAQDKREVVLFRLRLNELGEPGQRVLALRQLVEGFSKFLEVLRTINRREVLHRHDFSRLQTAQMLLESEEELPVVLEQLQPVYGRSEALDELLRAARTGAEVDTARWIAAVDGARAELAPG